nr:hypothetical protein CFP56_20928 [Quercus suber]
MDVQQKRGGGRSRPGRDTVDASEVRGPQCHPAVQYCIHSFVCGPDALHSQLVTTQPSGECSLLTSFTTRYLTLPDPTPE